MPKLRTLTESWVSNTINLVTWTSGFGSFAASGGTFVLTVNSGASNYSGMGSPAIYDLTNSSLTQELISAGNQSLVSFECYICQIAKDASNKFSFVINQNLVYCRRAIASVNSDLDSFAYDATSCKWFRIRETNGVVYWETSPDGVGWTTRSSSLLSALFAITLMNLEYSAGTFGAEGSGTTVVYGKVNIIPTNGVGNKFRNVTVGGGMGRSEGAT